MTFPDRIESRGVASRQGKNLRAGALDEVEIEVAASLSAYSERLAHRASSPLARLSENEISDGLARLEADAAAEALPRPVRHTQDLLTLELNG